MTQLPSRLCPPVPPPDMRVRGLSAVEGRPPVTVLTAGPGFGKTLAMRELVGDAPLVWLAADPDDDLTGFFTLLVTGVRAHVPAFGEVILALAGSDRATPRLLWQHFFRELEAYGLPELALALDDVHHASRELLQGLAAFLDKLPTGLRLYLASRSRFPAPLARLQAQNKLQVLGESALAFTPDEVEAFLAARAEGGPVPEAWRAAASTVDGWPLGLDLVARGGAHGLADGGEEALREVTEEIFLEQPDELRALMLRAALLEEVEAEACRAIFGIAEAHEQLAELEAANLLRRFGTGYRFPGYLQAFLREELARAVPGPQRLAWSRAAGSYYDEAGQPERALGLLLAARAWSEAAAVAERLFPELRFDGRHATLARFLDAFPADETDPVVLVWRGHAAARAGDHATARVHYEAARRQYEVRHDDAGVFRVIVRLCYLALVAHDLKGAGPLLLQALGLQAAGHPMDRADLALSRAYMAEHRGDMALMRECNLAALDVPVDRNVDVAASHGIALMNLYTAALHRGDLAEASGYLDRAVQLSEVRGFLPYRVFAGFLRTNLQLVRGEAAELPELPDGWRDLLDWHDLACAETIIGQWHEARGAWREAEEALTRAIATFDAAGVPAGRTLVLERQAWLALRRKAPDRVLALTAGAQEGSSVYDHAWTVPRGRAQQLTGDAAGAVATLEAAVSAFDGLEAKLHAARARLYLAAALGAAGRKPEALEAWTRARGAIAAQGYDFLLQQDPALRDELAALEGAPAAAAPAPSAGAVLELRLLGPFELVAGGQRIEKWPRKKSQLVLAALALAPRGLTLVELAELAAATDGEAAGPDGGTALRVAISYLRQVLEPELARGHLSRILPLVDERYLLSREHLASFDVADFEAGLDRSEALAKAGDLAEAEAACEGALALYRGHLLEAGFLSRFFDAEREHLRRRALQALLWLAERRGGAQREALLRRATLLAPTDDAPWLALLRFYTQANQPEKARQAYWDARKAYKKHLGIAPGEALEAAHRELTATAKPAWAAR